MTKTLKVVVVGAGRAGADFHVPGFNGQESTQVVGFVDPNEGNASNAAAVHGVAHTYRELRDALAQEIPDIVAICSPPQYHLQQAMEAMRAGAHVLLEKPLAMNIEEADQIRACQIESGVKLCLVHNYKFLPGTQAAIKLVRRGELGRLLHIERTWLRNGTQDRMITDKDCWCHTIPGGRWGETAAHDIYIVYEMVGDMTLCDVAVHKFTDRWPWLVADEVSVTLRSSEGYVGLRYSANVEERLFRYMTLHGSRAVAVADEKSIQLLPFKQRKPPAVVYVEPPYVDAPRQFVNGTKALTKAALRRIGVLPKPNKQAESEEQNGRRQQSASRKHDPLAACRGTGHLAVIEGFVQYVRGLSEPPVTWEEAYRTMSLVHQIGEQIDRFAGSR